MSACMAATPPPKPPAGGCRRSGAGDTFEPSPSGWLLHGHTSTPSSYGGPRAAGGIDVPRTLAAWRDAASAVEPGARPRISPRTGSCRMEVSGD